MRPSILFSLVLMLFCGLACEDPNTASSSSTTPATPDTEERSTPQPAAPATTKPVRTAHNCELVGKPLDDGSFWLAERERLFVVVADTGQLYDKEYSDSYRSFQIYDTEKCDLIGNHVMPVNRSPDYPYYLYPNTFEKVNEVICAQGFDFVYCYNVARREMMMPLDPGIPR